MSIEADIARHEREEVEAAKRWERKMDLADERLKKAQLSTDDVQSSLRDASYHLCMQITAALNAGDLTYAGGLLRDVVLYYLAEQEEDDE